jgi:hypothetical protein
LKTTIANKVIDCTNYKEKTNELTSEFHHSCAMITLIGLASNESYDLMETNFHPDEIYDKMIVRLDEYCAFELSQLMPTLA